MTNPEIARLRLHNQHIVKQSLKTPHDIVKYLGAVQAQDYFGAKWAIGLRLQKSNDAAVEKAMAKGDTIRTHVLRPTWHFVSPDDVRWMLTLTAPKIKALAAPYYRQLELDIDIFKRSNDVLGKALENNTHLNRAELTLVLNQGGIKTDEQRLVHLLMYAELDQVICSGGRQGKQFTYALFDDRVPVGNLMAKEEAIANLALRYFISRAPATLHDFSWWSGLNLGEAKTGLESIKNKLTDRVIDGTIYWMAPELPDMTGKAPLAYLLPAYDEFAVSYADRSATVNAKYTTQARHVIFDPSIVVNSQVVGTWKRIIKKEEVEITLNPFGKLSKVQTKAIDAAGNKYRKFINS